MLVASPMALRLWACFPFDANALPSAKAVASRWALGGAVAEEVVARLPVVSNHVRSPPEVSIQASTFSATPFASSFARIVDDHATPVALDVFLELGPQCHKQRQDHV